ncbi:MAG: helix-turn-helix transcriptional regulator [Sedimentisphaerales bacterium]|nr:helix-turn-helix transcriptional regulator [Sedimentisphaerales bacterium]
MSNAEKQDWYQTIKAAVLASGMSQQEISQKAKINKSVMSRFMSGERMPSFKNTEKLADALGLILRKTKGGKR